MVALQWCGGQGVVNLCGWLDGWARIFFTAVHFGTRSRCESAVSSLLIDPQTSAEIADLVRFSGTSWPLRQRAAGMAVNAAEGQGQAVAAANPRRRHSAAAECRGRSRPCTGPAVPTAYQEGRIQETWRGSPRRCAHTCCSIATCRKRLVQIHGHAYFGL